MDPRASGKTFDMTQKSSQKNKVTLKSFKTETYTQDEQPDKFIGNFKQQITLNALDFTLIGII